MASSKEDSHVLDAKTSSASLATEMTWLAPAVAALRKCDALYITAGAGMSADSGLPTFRSKEGFWKAYPPALKAGLSFSQVSNPATFDTDERAAWGFFGHRYQLYTKAEPHRGYDILRGFSDKVGKSFVFTSNVDGMFERAGFSAGTIYECHGSIHYVQARRPVDSRHPLQADRAIIPATDTCIPTIEIDEHFRVVGDLPLMNGKPSRPNVMMFGDYHFVSKRSDAQEDRKNNFIRGLSKSCKLVVVEIGAGKAVPTVRYESESILQAFRNATLLRINVDEPFNEDCPERTISIPMGAKSALEAIEAAME